MKVALLGVWHVHAPGYFNEAKEAGAEIVGIWDPDPAKVEDFLKDHETAVFESREALLASDAEGVIVCSSTDRHVEDIVACCKAGKHVFTEKVLAMTTAECETIEAAVKEAGVNFVISLVQKYRPAPKTVKKIIDSGEIGEINYYRFRNCHDGSTGRWLPEHFFHKNECGGGAMIDLGAHGMYLLDWILGLPESATSTFTIFDQNPLNVDDLEDNAVTVMRYKNGAIAINETGFDTVGFPMEMEIGGTKGYIVYQNETVTKTLKGQAPEVVTLEPESPAPVVQFVTGNVLPGCGMAEAKNLTKLMEMAYI